MFWFVGYLKNDFFIFFYFEFLGELEYCYYSNVASIRMEFIGSRISTIIVLLGICNESVARWLAFENIWWEVRILKEVVINYYGLMSKDA